MFLIRLISGCIVGHFIGCIIAGIIMDEGKRPDEADTPLILFGNGWRPTDVEDIFYQWPDTFEATEDFVQEGAHKWLIN